MLVPKEEMGHRTRLVEEMFNGATTRVRTECGVPAGFPEQSRAGVLWMYLITSTSTFHHEST